MTVDITLSGSACDHPVITGATASAVDAPGTNRSARQFPHGATGGGQGGGRMADPHTRRSGAVFEDGLGASTTTPQQRQKLDLIKQFDGASLLSEG